MKRCQVCGELFETNRKDKKYCSDNCRKLKSKSWGKVHIGKDDYTTSNIYLKENAIYERPQNSEIMDAIDVLYDFGLKQIDVVPEFHTRLELSCWKKRMINTVFK